MLQFIEINNSLLGRVRDRHENVLRSINNEQQCNDTIESKKAVPLKEYSNKFLRENQFNLRQKENEKASKNSRLNNLITKHKFFQKKFTGPACKNIHVCKTEPNENEYKCFMTSNHFYRDVREGREGREGSMRTNTESIARSNNLFFEFENEQWRHGEAELDLKSIKQRIQSKNRSKGEMCPRTEEKISASRALQMYAKIISKDRSDLVEKIRFSNQKKSVKDKILESRKNLEICQINLLEKQKKLSFVEKVEKKEEKPPSKSLIKFRKKTKSVDFKILAKEEENFELKGWDN